MGIPKLFGDRSGARSIWRRVAVWCFTAGMLAVGAAILVIVWIPNTVTTTRSLVSRSLPTPILILGTFHFAGSSDWNYEQPEGVLSEARQQELQVLAARISAFEPTKVLLEWTPDLEATTNERYRAYLRDEFELGENEVYQIGFRVARMSGLPSVHLVDHSIGLPSGRPLAERFGQGSVFDELEAENRAWNENRPNRDRDNWLDVFIDMNSPENIQRDHSYYIDALPLVGTDGEYQGTDVTATWYKRNLRIYTNIARLNQEGDRLFLLIGAGHLGVLREMFASSSRFELVDPLRYLEENAAQQGVRTCTYGPPRG